MKKNNKLTSLMMSVTAIVVLFAMLIGSTFAWFTDSVNSKGNKIQAGTLKVDLELLDKEEGWKSLKNDDTPIFDYVMWEPGYTDVKIFKVENEGSLALKWNVKFVSENELSALANVIDVYVLPSATEIGYPTDRNLDGYTRAGTLNEFINNIEVTTHGVLLANECAYLGIALKMQENAGNEYQGLDLGGCFDITIIATQLSSEVDGFDDGYDSNAEYPWETEYDGSVSTEWYDQAEESATEYTLNSAADFAGFAQLVATENFEGKTIILGNDVNLKMTDENGYPISFAPIGSNGERDERNRLITAPFKGTFDGQGHTISNVYQSGWDFGYEWGQYGSVGLFSQLENATVKNVTISGFTAEIEGGDIAAITGSAEGTCVFENITIENSSYGTYNNGIGGIIGWSGAGEYTFKDITIASDVMFGGLWGSFDSSVGGIVGQAEPGATYKFENVDIACRLDVFNDVTASYDYYNYRMSGMIIGRCEETTTIDGVNYPDISKYNFEFKNVTVTYGAWADYHYCRPEGGRGVRVEAGYAYGGIAEDYDHTTCTVHHMDVIPFDQLIGGDQFGVKGLREVSGITVIYNK